MINRKIIIFLIFLLSGLALAAEGSAFELDGSIKFSINDDNLLKNEYIEEETGPAIDSEVILEGSFGELLKNETLEVGLSLDLGEALTFIEGDSPDSIYTDGKNNYYDKIQIMIDWYMNNRARYGMSDYPGNYSGSGWPTTSYGGSTRYRFIHGSTVEDINDVVWTQTKWDSAELLFEEIETHIKDEIEAISPINDAGDLKQFDLDGLTVAEQKVVLKEKEASDSFDDAYLGISTSSTMGELISDAYIRIKNIGGILDLTMEYNGRKVGVGKSIESIRAEQRYALLGVEAALALDEETLPELSASLLAVMTGSEKTSSEDWASASYDKDKGEFSDLGLLLNAAYSVKGLGSLEIEGGLLDAVNPRNFVLGVYPTLDVWHMAKLKIAGEFDLIGFDDEDISDDFAIGMGAALDMQATFIGVTPRIQLFWKNDQFYGDGSANEAEDRLPGTSFMDDFNSTNVKMAAAADGGAYFDTAKLIGREIFSIGGGYNLFIYDPLSDSRLLRHGWYAGLNVTLKDLAEIPLTVNFNMNKYNPDEQITFEDFEGTGPDASFLDGLYWDFSVEYAFSDNLAITVACTGSDSGYRLDTSHVVTWDLSATASF